MQQISYFILEAKIENVVMYIAAVKLAVGITILNKYFQGK